MPRSHEADTLAANDDEVRQALRNEGYAIVRGLLPADLCHSTTESFANEVKPFGGPLLRQASARREPHQLSAGGLVVNGLLGIQDLPPDRFPCFVRDGLAVVTHSRMQDVLRALLGGPPRVVETMYFESSLGNGTHADTHYMDSTETGSMIGAWIALEDIQPEAGRFFVYPRSHLLETAAPEFAAVRDAYHSYEELVVSTNRTFIERDPLENAIDRIAARRQIARIIDAAGLQRVAPALATGDVLFWSSRVLHGSLAPDGGDVTRHSITAHYVNTADEYRVHAATAQRFQVRSVSGMPVQFLMEE